MHILRLGVALTLLLLPSAALAQNELGISFGGGLTLVPGESGDEFGNGLNFAARTVFPLSQRLAVEMAIGYQDIRLKTAAEARRRGHDPEVFRLGGGFVEGGDRRALEVMARGQLFALPRSGRLAPYVMAGAGVGQVRTTDKLVYFLNSWDNEPGSTEMTLMADAGGGLQVRLSSIVSSFVQASYMTLFTDGGRTTMLPLHLGLLVELGRR